MVRPVERSPARPAPRQCSLFLVVGITLTALLMDLDALFPGLYVPAFVVGLVGFYASVQLWRTRSLPGSLSPRWGLMARLVADAAARPLFWAVAVGGGALGLLVYGAGRLLRRGGAGSTEAASPGAGASLLLLGLHGPPGHGVSGSARHVGLDDPRQLAAEPSWRTWPPWVTTRSYTDRVAWKSWL